MGDDNKKIELDSPLTSLKGVGGKTAALFAARDIRTLRDLLLDFPRTYEQYEEPVRVDHLVPGKVCAVSLVIVGTGSTVHAGRYRITYFNAADETGRIRLTYYNMPFLQKTLQAGSRHIFRGMVRQYRNGNLQLEQARVYTPADYASLEGTLLPVYPLGKGMKNALRVKLMRQVLEEAALPAEYIPEGDLQELGLLGREDAFRKIHFPDTKEGAVQARNRLVFDELFNFILAVRENKEQQEEMANPDPMIPVADTVRLIESLPYPLTDAQKKAWSEIEQDLTGPHIMNRLLQGDVGSGKTILAFLALVLCAANGHQGALMAPTEVLARQHMAGMKEMAERYHLPVHPVLLTGAVKGTARRKVLSEIKSGEANVIIGTHALIQESVEYHHLGLAITDEQHRFGVRERQALQGKGAQVPVLVMSATPIPRTLSIILYGDLSVSRLTEKPAERLPIKNLCWPAANRRKVLQFLLSKVRQGRQAYIICPAVEESEEEEEIFGGSADLQNVMDYADRLRKVFPPDIRIGVLHGRMKPAEKEQVMDAFGAGNIDVLVSTTVVEVGIDVPNATVMLIENAERFGLSQLHQLRGRVGRGSEQSYCIFLYEGNTEEKPERLDIIEHCNDGFRIAEEDLRLRGPGDLFGVRQSGEMGFILADIYADKEICSRAAAYAEKFLAAHPGTSVEKVKSVDFRSI